MKFDYWFEGIVIIGLFLIVVGLPCIAVAVLGTKLINRLGYQPSKSAAISFGVCAQLLVVEMISFGMLYALLAWLDS